MTPLSLALILVTTAAAGGAGMDAQEARGRFEVKVTPASAADAPVTRMGLAKTWSGDIVGTSAGEMLS